MPSYFHTNWTPQFGDPILPPKNETKPKKKRERRGSWRRPSKTMVDRELAKCKRTRIDPDTGEVLEIKEPTSRARVSRWGQTGRAPHKPKR